MVSNCYCCCWLHKIHQIITRIIKQYFRRSRMIFFLLILMIKPLLVIIHGHYMKWSIIIYKLEQDNAQTTRWKLGSNGIFHHVPGWSHVQRSTFVSWWGNDSVGFRKNCWCPLYPEYQNLREFKVLKTVFYETVLLHLYDAHIWYICIIIYNNI